VEIEENNKQALTEKLKLIRKIKEVKEKSIGQLEQKSLPTDFQTHALELKN